MKIIEALKQTKDLRRKLDDLKGKIALMCADMDYENPTYPDQKSQVSGWLQAYRDIVHEIERLSFCIQKTNVLTPVTIQLGDNHVTKSISQWIMRRKELAGIEQASWNCLGNRGLKDHGIQQTSGNVMAAKVRLYFDPVQRDKMKDLLSSEPALIDAKLEIVNAITDLIE